jgi:oligoribonuclease
MFWIDLETSGLTPQTEIVMEVGCMVTDQWGQELDYFEELIKYDPKQYNWDISAEPFVKTMHANSGLFQQVINKKEGTVEHLAWEHLDDFIVRHGISPDRDPMCGSSVAFDRSFIEWHAPQELVNRFHYRNIDVSSDREIMKRVAPTLYAKMSEQCKSREKHRVRPDLEDTLDLYRWMIENFYRVDEVSW